MVSSREAEHIHISFMVAGHTKFASDRLFSIEDLKLICQQAAASFIIEGDGVHTWREHLGAKYSALPGVSTLRGEYMIFLNFWWSHLNNHNYILLHPMDLIFVPKCSSLNKLSDGIFDLSIWAFLCQVHSKTVRSPTYPLKKIF